MLYTLVEKHVFSAVENLFLLCCNAPQGVQTAVWSDQLHCSKIVVLITIPVLIDKWKQYYEDQ
jgi:hypothetical protein